MKKFAALFLAMALCLTVFTACAAPAPAPQPSAAPSDNGGAPAPEANTDPILIGGVNDLSGNRSVTGNAIDRGVKIAIDEINEAGGILGRQVSYQCYDNKNDAQETINAYTRLVEMEKVSAVITSDASTICMSLIEVSGEKEVPVLGMPSDPRATMDMDKGEVYPYMFLVSQPNAYAQATLIATYVAENTDLESTAIFYDQSNAYAVASVDAFRKVWTEDLGKTISLEQTFNSTDQDYKTQLSKIKASGADSIFCPVATTQLVLMANQAVQLGMDLPYIGAMDMANPFLSLVNSPEKINAYFEAVADMGSDRLADLNAKYRALYNEDAQVKTVNGYDAMYILKAAIEAAGSDDPKAIRDALENDISNLKLLVSDSYTQDPATHAPKNLGMVVCKIENGELSTVGWFETK